MKREDVEALPDGIRRAMKASGDYAMATWRIARRLDATTRAVRSELVKMEKAGEVERVPNWCAVNNTVWRLVAGEVG